MAHPEALGTVSIPGATRRFSFIGINPRSIGHRLHTNIDTSIRINYRSNQHHLHTTSDASILLPLTQIPVQDETVCHDLAVFLSSTTPSIMSCAVLLSSYMSARSFTVITSSVPMYEISPIFVSITTPPIMLCTILLVSYLSARSLTVIRSSVPML